LIEKIRMISKWARRDNWWTNIGSPDFVFKPELRGNLETRRHESYDLSGLKKNNMWLNNKIRVIQRRAYGLRDEDYLRLKILTCMLKEI
jgi:hypothetical protein